MRSCWSLPADRGSRTTSYGIVTGFIAGLAPLRVAKGVLKDAVVVEQQHARLVVDLVSNHCGMAGTRETILQMILSA